MILTIVRGAKFLKKKIRGMDPDAEKDETGNLTKQDSSDGFVVTTAKTVAHLHRERKAAKHAEGNEEEENPEERSEQTTEPEVYVPTEAEK